MDITWKYASPIDAKIIENEAKKNRVILPKLLIRIIHEGNNGSPSKKMFKYSNNEDIFKTLLSYSKSDIENVYSAIKILKEAGEKLYPFANTPAGNLICLQGDHVVLWNHENGLTTFISENIDTFLKSLS